MVGVFSDSVSSADGINTQRPLEQRNNARGRGGSGRNARGRGQSRDTVSNDRPKLSRPAQPANVTPSSNDVASEPAAVSGGNEAGDSFRSAVEKPPPAPNPSREPSENNSETAGTDVTPSTSAVTSSTD